MLKTIAASQWDAHYPDSVQSDAIDFLEQGNILHFPTLPFSLLPEEKQFLTPECADPSSKNISYDPTKNRLWGACRLSDGQRIQLKNMLGRYAQSSRELIKHLLSPYAKHLALGRTSYQPIQVVGRQTSYRKDDKRIHVDAFPSAPSQGHRILRVFCNINPNGEDRIWRIGEPFDDVTKRFVPIIAKPMPGKAALLRLLKITKRLRTPYDHYMLKIHDYMKADMHYQETVAHEDIKFSPGCAWIALTDQLSHAAMSGQFLLEQTFYLPVNAMRNESLSPLHRLETMLGQSLSTT